MEDNFDTDPMSGVGDRWVNETGGAEYYDSVKQTWLPYLQVDIGFRYTSAEPLSFDHTAQCTSTGTATRYSGPAVRFDNTGVNDYYGLAQAGSGLMTIMKFVAGVRTSLFSSSALNGTVDAADWLTQRLEAVGGEGNPVYLKTFGWNHDTVKPTSAPDWNMDFRGRFIDTAADRMDNATDLQVGIAGRATGVADNVEVDYWKARAISDEFEPNQLPDFSKRNTIIRGGVFRGGVVR